MSFFDKFIEKNEKKKMEQVFELIDMTEEKINRIGINKYKEMMNTVLTWLIGWHIKCVKSDCGEPENWSSYPDLLDMESSTKLHKTASKPFEELESPVLSGLLKKKKKKKKQTKKKKKTGKKKKK